MTYTYNYTYTSFNFFRNFRNAAAAPFFDGPSSYTRHEHRQDRDLDLFIRASSEFIEDNEPRGNNMKSLYFALVSFYAILNTLNDSSCPPLSTCLNYSKRLKSSWIFKRLTSCTHTHTHTHTQTQRATRRTNFLPFSHN